MVADLSPSLPTESAHESVETPSVVGVHECPVCLRKKWQVGDEPLGCPRSLSDVVADLAAGLPRSLP